MQNSKEVGHIGDTAKRTKKDLIEKGSAQKIVSIGFSDELFKNPPKFRVSCKCFEDLESCAEIIGPYNEFNPKKIKAAKSLFTVLYRAFYMLDLSIGREDSPVIYITSFATDSQDVRMLIKAGDMYSAEKIKSMKKEFRNFKKICKEVARMLSVTECHFSKEGIYKTCRIWWD